MAVTGGTTTNSMSKVTAREVDFVTRFTNNWEDFKAILGITNAIRKQPGTKLVSYVTKSKNGLASQVGEGQEITFTEFEVTPKSYADITIEKYAKSVSVEAVAKYGASIAVQKTDDAFLNELQGATMDKFYTELKKGSLAGTATTWQKALAIAKGKVLDKFKVMRKTVTDVVAFANLMDYYEWLGDQQISVQTLNGIQYIKDFMGYSTVFLCSANEIPVGKVIATPVENLDLYYVDPADSEFAELGLTYTTQGETNLIGFHAEGDYSRASGDAFAITGMTLWAEYQDGIANITVTPAAAAAEAPTKA